MAKEHTKPTRTPKKIKLLNREFVMSRKAGIVVIFLLVLIGYFIFASFAATGSYIRIGANQMTVTAPATIAADSTAASGKYVQFNQPAPPPPPPPDGSVGAPSDVGLTIPAANLKKWTGSTTITPTTAGVVNGKVEGYLFTSRINVQGNVTFTNDKWSFQDNAMLVIQGNYSPGPSFSHIEVDGQRSTTYPDNIGVVNNSDAHTATASKFTMDHAWIHSVGNGMRLYTGANVSNSKIDDAFVTWNADANDYSHTDGIELYCGSNITLDHLTIIMGTPTGPSNGSNGAIETQGGSGGFCPVSNVTETNNFFSGGYATYRVADDQNVTHIVSRNNVIEKGKSYYFAVTVTNPANIDVWDNIRLSDGTPIPTPGTWSECAGYGGSCH